MRRSFDLFWASIVLVIVSSFGVSSFCIPKRIPTIIQERAKTAIARRIETRSNKKYNLLAVSGGSDGQEQSKETNDWIPIPTASEAYYLVWSPKFVQKLALATTLLVCIRRFGIDHRLFGAFAKSLGWVPPGLVPNFLLPLISSSCCAIQLAVNAVSVAVMGAGAGCLGFNTYLGPLRPYLLGAMVAYHTVPSTAYTLVRYAIALMPEAVSGWNELLRLRWRRNRNTVSKGEANLQATVVVEVPTMGCVACVNKIESSLRNRAPDNIESASAILNPKPATEGGKKGGKAKIQVRVSSKEELDDLAKSLVGAIEDAGFQDSTIEMTEIKQ